MPRVITCKVLGINTMEYILADGLCILYYIHHAIQSIVNGLRFSEYYGFTPSFLIDASTPPSLICVHLSIAFTLWSFGPILIFLASWPLWVIILE